MAFRCGQIVSVRGIDGLSKVVKVNRYTNRRTLLNVTGRDGELYAGVPVRHVRRTSIDESALLQIAFDAAQLLSNRWTIAGAYRPSRISNQLVVVFNRPDNQQTMHSVVSRSGVECVNAGRPKLVQS